MICCISSPIAEIDTQSVQREVRRYDAQDKDARITVLALGMIALFLFAVACVLLGLGTMPPTTFMGLGMLPYLGGVFLNFLSLGIFTGALVFSVVAAVRTHQKDLAQARVMD